MQSEDTLPTAHLTHATVMFADILGFTALSESAGVERAYLVVTECLRLLDDAIREQGGAVDKYLGDCLMAVFGHPVALADAEAAAVRAALRMRERVAQYNAENNLEIPLSVVIGINTGPMVGGDISGPLVREFHVLGDGVNVAARMKAKAPRDRIYVGPETREQTHADYEYSALGSVQFKGKTKQVAVFELLGPRGDAPAAVHTSDPAQHVESHPIENPVVPPRSGVPEAASDAERRRATILFADISGFTSMTEQLGAEEAYPIVARALEILDEVARKYGGTVEKYLGDCVLALFGVPRAIEDAPRAAINAAIEMRERILEFNAQHGSEVVLDVHSGINTGLGIAGDISGSVIRESAVMGDPVSIADQLKDLAPVGRIYVGGEAHRFARDTFEFRELPPIKQKGSDLPVPTFDLVSTEVRIYRARTGDTGRISSELVGRDAELGVLRSMLERTESGTGGAVSIVAEAGVGKSRLIAELQSGDPSTQRLWLEGRALSNGLQMSFHPLADLLRGWAVIDDDDQNDGALEKLRGIVTDLIPEDAAEVFPLMATLMGMRLDSKLASQVAEIQGDALARKIQLGFGEMLRRETSRRPVAIVIDDLHWADQSSIELLEAALDLLSDHPVLFIYLFRPGHPTTSQRILEFLRQNHAARHDEIVLEPLAAAGARQLIHNLFQNGDIPFKTREVIESKTHGNPFYIEEVVRSLVDAGAVEYRDGGFCATELIHEFEIPGTVQEVVMARVDHLEPEKRHLLQVASVVGGSFHRDVIAEVTDEESLDMRVEELIAADFIVPWDRTAGIEYAFKHPLIQEVTYDGLLQTKREELHRAVADAMDARLPADLPGIDGMLAYHLSMGRDVERAEDYLFRAGDEAAKAAGSSEALHFFREASKLYFDLHGEGGDPAKKALLQKRIALALYYRGQLIEAADAFDSAIELLGEHVPRSNVAMALNSARSLAVSMFSLYAPRLRHRPEATDVEQEVMDLMFQRSLCEVTADANRFLFDSIAMLGKLSRVEPSSVQAAGGMYAGTSVLFSYGGISFAIGQRLLEVARRNVNPDDSAGVIRFKVMNFTHHFLAGDWSKEHEIPEPLLHEGLRTGKIWDVLTYLCSYGEKLVCTGDFSDARAGIGFNDKVWEEYQNDGARSQHGYLVTHLLLEERKLPEALQAADEYYRDNPEALIHVNALGLRAKAEILLGDLDAAEATLDRCAEIISELGALMVPHYQKAEFFRSQLMLEVERLREMVSGGSGTARRKQYRRALRVGQKAQASAGWKTGRQTEVFRLIGLAHSLGGRPRRALQAWKRGLTIGEQLGTRPEMARIRQEIGTSRHNFVSGDLDPDTQLNAARAQFEQLGLHWDLQQSGIDDSCP